MKPGRSRMPSRAKRFGAALIGCAAVWATHALWGHTTSAVQPSGTTVRPLFDFRSPERSPFPSDVFTVADSHQNTGRRVNLPMPQDCRTYASDCEDVAVLNQLDGFNMQARIAVPFDGDIDPSSVSRKTIFLAKLRDALTKKESDRRVVGINYVVWDPATRELSFRPDNSLDQHTTYALVITTGVRDAAGNPIGVVEPAGAPDPPASADYRRVLEETASAVRKAGALARGLRIAALSVFTTQTFSHTFERMYEAIRRAPGPTVNFNVGPDGTPAVFAVPTLASLTVNNHVRVQGPGTPEPLPN